MAPTIAREIAIFRCFIGSKLIGLTDSQLLGPTGFVGFELRGHSFQQRKVFGAHLSHVALDTLKGEIVMRLENTGSAHARAGYVAAHYGEGA